MYNPHTTDCLHVEIRQSFKGRGVFATSNIPRNTLIADFIGDVFTSDIATGLPAIMVDHAVQIGPDHYVHAHNRLAEIINHSCDPCAGVKNLTQIVTIRDIEKGEEITWDYAMTEMSDWRMHNCLCGTKKCRGTVGSFLLLPDTIKQDYLEQGIVSDWIKKQLSL